MNAEVKIDDIVIAACPHTMIELVWDRCLPHIQKVVDIAGNDMTTQSVYNNLISGKHLLVLMSRGTDIINVITMDIRISEAGYKILYLPVVGGSEMDLWLDRFLDLAKQIAKDYECKEIRGMTSRKGWMRVLKNHGWEELYTTIKFDLGE